jgi:hypothetical protein
VSRLARELDLPGGPAPAGARRRAAAGEGFEDGLGPEVLVDVDGEHRPD